MPYTIRLDKRDPRTLKVSKRLVHLWLQDHNAAAYGHTYDRSWFAKPSVPILGHLTRLVRKCTEHPKCEGGHQRFNFGVHIVDGKKYLDIQLTSIRLPHKKEYYGQSPEPDQYWNNPYRTRMKSCCLQWEDWVAFNNLVNDAIDKAGCPAEVWSKPMVMAGRMWIRKNDRRRVRYDYEELPESREGMFGRIELKINPGTDDQFAEAS